MAEELLHTKIELSERIFCFYTLLNSSGYHPERGEIHPVRTRVIAAIQKQFTDTITSNAKALLENPEKAKEYWHPYRTWVLCHGQPPQFAPLSEYWKKFLNNNEGEGLGALLKELWSNHGVSELWEREKSEYQRTEKQCRENAERAACISLEYLRTDANNVPFTTFVVIPNFLDEYSRALGPLIEKTAYALMGPSPDENDPFPEERIQHEFLHSIVNPLSAKMFSKSSPQERSKLREMLINGIVLQTHREDLDYVARKREHLLRKHMDMEMTLRALARYERSDKDFRGFLETNAEKIKEACR